MIVGLTLSIVVADALTVAQVDASIERARKKRRVIQRDMDRIVKHFTMIKERFVIHC